MAATFLASVLAAGFVFAEPDESGPGVIGGLTPPAGNAPVGGTGLAPPAVMTPVAAPGLLEPTTGRTPEPPGTPATEVGGAGIFSFARAASMSFTILSGRSPKSHAE